MKSFFKVLLKDLDVFLMFNTIVVILAWLILDLSFITWFIVGFIVYAIENLFWEYCWN